MKIKEIIEEHLIGQASPVGSVLRKERKTKKEDAKKKIEDLVKKAK